MEAKDISRALNYMQDRSGFAEKALLEYKVEKLGGCKNLIDEMTIVE